MVSLTSRSLSWLSTLFLIGGALLYWETFRGVALVLIFAGATMFLAHFVSLQIARSESRWVRIRDRLKLSLALISIGGAVGSASSLTSLVLSSGFIVIGLVIAIILFLSGIVAMVFSIANL